MGRLCMMPQAWKAGAWDVRKAGALLDPVAQPCPLQGWADPAASPTPTWDLQQDGRDGTDTPKCCHSQV